VLTRKQTNKETAVKTEDAARSGERQVKKPRSSCVFLSGTVLVETNATLRPQHGEQIIRLLLLLHLQNIQEYYLLDRLLDILRNCHLQLSR